MENIVNYELKEEIYKKQNKIIKHNLDCKKKEIICKDIRSIGDAYSFWMENPELRNSLLSSQCQPQTVKKQARKGIEYVHNGWYYLIQLNPFMEKLNPDVLKKLNKIVEWQYPNEKGKFRMTPVSLNYKNFTPPNYLKIPTKVDEMLNEVKEMYKESPIEAAITAHFRLAGIQAFYEGNKRGARLIQDRILYEANLPPAIITAGEGILYRTLLGEALAFKDDLKDSNVKNFYNYCASKINNSLDDILGDLKV